MNREIKFRAWSDKLQEYASDYDTGDNAMVEWIASDGSFSVSTKELGCSCSPEGCGGCIDRYEKVEDAALEQFTGLYVFDKVEVYEGDKLEFVVFDCFGNDKEYQGVVVYDGSRFMLWKEADDEFYGADGGFDLDWVLSQDDEAKVIGNIHENQR